MDEIIKWVKIVVLRTMREKNLIHLDTDTLISAGLLGYSQARKRFDPGREVKFKTFAEYRIKGAVLDEVRKMIGDERCKTTRPRQVDYDFALIGDNGHNKEMVESQLAVDGFWEKIPVSKRDKEILECRIKGMNLKEIGALFGFSESRASQVLAEIKQRIYPVFKKHLGADFTLIDRTCPSCDHTNRVIDSAFRFECESCELTVEIKGGVWVAEGLELSEKDE